MTVMTLLTTVCIRESRTHNSELFYCDKNQTTEMNHDNCFSNSLAPSIGAFLNYVPSMKKALKFT